MKFLRLGKLARTIFIPQKIEPPYSHIVQIGDPVLREKCSEIPPETIKSNEVQSLIQHMITIMRKFDCVGLACNQIGMPYRIISLEFEEKLKDQYGNTMYQRREMQTLPLTVIINPKLKVTNYEKVIDVESCASVKGYSGEVARYKGINLTGYDENGIHKKLELNGWNARIVQHEVDHLDGVLYTDRMNPKTLTCTLWEAVNAKGGRVELPFYVK